MTKHRALVTAPFRGPGLETLRSFADVVLDPWIDHQPLRIYDADTLAERVKAEEADLLAEADVVSMHAAVTPDSAGMIGAEQFTRMREGAIYLNTARAMLHDTDALTASLADGHLGGAGLDHFVGEHLATDHPLCSMANVVLTPHIGGATYDTEANHTTLIVDGLVSLLDGGTPSNLVNPEVLT